MLYRANQSELFGIALGDASFRGVASASPPAFKATARTNGFTDSSTIALPTRTLGDYLFGAYCQSFGGGILPSLNAGWSQVGVTRSLASSDFALFTKISDGTDESPFSTNPMGGGGITIISVSGVTTGVDDSQSNTGVASTSIVAPSATATGSADFQFCVYGASGSTSDVITVPGGQTAVPACNDGSFATLRVGYQTLAASGATGTRTATGGTSLVWAGFNTLVK